MTIMAEIELNANDEGTNPADNTESVVTTTTNIVMNTNEEDL
jgi:hypothetical protein